MLQTIAIPAFTDNYIWLMRDPEQPWATIVDPGDAAPVRAYLSEHDLQLSAILLTHHHWDHAGGVKELATEYQIPVFGPSQEARSVVTEALIDGAKFNVPELDIDFNVLKIPGHTLGHIAFYRPGQLFSGDTLFTAGCGRLFEGTAEQMFASLSKLSKLADETALYCGHEYTASNLAFAQSVEPNNMAIAKRKQETKKLRAKDLATVPSILAIEKQTNPFLRCHVPEVKQAVAEHFDCALPKSDVKTFALLREWKDNFVN